MKRKTGEIVNNNPASKYITIASSKCMMTTLSKYISIIMMSLFLIMGLAVLPQMRIVAHAQGTTTDASGECGENATYAFDNGVLTITGTGSSATIAEDFFKEHTDIKEVVIENIYSIRYRAFMGCTGITKVIIPGTVYDIKTCAFDGCTSLSDLTIENGVDTIGPGAFSGCTSLVDLNIPESVTMIQSEAFDGCTGLKELVIPKSVEYIGNFAFRGCTGLEKVVIGDTAGDTANYRADEIGISAFEGCTSLKDLTLGENIKTIAFEAFKDCTSLTSVTMPKNIAQVWIDDTGIYQGGIYAGAFNGCTKLKNYYVASGNNKLTSIDGVLFTKIGGKQKLLLYPPGRSGEYTVP